MRPTNIGFLFMANEDIINTEKLKLIELVEFFYKHYKTLNFKSLWIEFDKLKEQLNEKK